MDFLKKIAPTLATAIVGPLGGLAVEAIGKAFGWEDATVQKVEEMLTNGQLSSEDIAKLKMAELEMLKHERELGFRFAELQLKDAQAEHAEQQATIRSGDNAEDTYVRHTRPLMARQSWYGMGVYIFAFEVAKAFDTGTGASFELAALIGAPGLAYIGFRSVFDKFGLTGKVGSMLSRK